MPSVAAKRSRRKKRSRRLRIGSHRQGARQGPCQASGEHPMRTLHKILIALFALASQPALADDAADVRAANNRWTVAMKAKDMAAVEKIVGPEFVLTRGQASDAKERVERAAWIANLKQMTFAVYRADVTDVQVTGDFAVAKVDGEWSVTQSGHTRSGPF